ncbi:MAG: hypothetical protein FVQ83_08235 [Chloroflexi bacterium]|nr:hypothetical protein [Chloroflexota bacterium]
MNKYAKSALEAVRLVKESEEIGPKKAWEIATSNYYGVGTPSQKKSCPKCTFLGLCDEGLINGIPPGNYTNSAKNKKYAIDAIELLSKDSQLAKNKNALWIKVFDGKPITHNDQMDVVIALWKKGLIKVK